MILLKIVGNKVEGNWEEIVELAEAYDQGGRSEDAYHAKIITLIFDRGYEEAMRDMETVNQRTLLLMSSTGGHA